MDGIEALQALKEGKTVIRWTTKSHDPQTSDIYFVFRSRKLDDSENPANPPHPAVWMRWRDEWVWTKCSEDIRYWLTCDDDDFDIVEDE